MIVLQSYSNLFARCVPLAKITMSTDIEYVIERNKEDEFKLS